MDDKSRPLHITVLAGGISAERDISLLSGNQIAAALQRRGHQVTLADIAPDDLSALEHRPCDLIFPALHGLFGEDGTLQEILERGGIPFVGSGSVASRLAMDKIDTKIALAAYGLPTPAWQTVQALPAETWTPDARIGLPCVIKPVAEGSSVGCRICRDAEEARAHLQRTLPRYGRMLVEKFIEGLELTVGVLDAAALPAIHIHPRADFYDYNAKYVRADTEYHFVIDLPAAVLEAVRNLALRTYQAVAARHLARVDVMVDRRTLEPFILEINTLPGFTSHSLVPKAAAHAGVPFDELCDRLARMALANGCPSSPRPGGASRK